MSSFTPNDRSFFYRQHCNISRRRYQQNKLTGISDHWPPVDHYKRRAVGALELSSLHVSRPLNCATVSTNAEWSFITVPTDDGAAQPTFVASFTAELVQTAAN
jgi:hypothetical protein